MEILGLLHQLVIISNTQATRDAILGWREGLASMTYGSYHLSTQAVFAFLPRKNASAMARYRTRYLTLCSAVPQPLSHHFRIIGSIAMCRDCIIIYTFLLERINVHCLFIFQAAIRQKKKEKKPKLAVLPQGQHSGSDSKDELKLPEQCSNNDRGRHAGATQHARKLLLHRETAPWQLPGDSERWRDEKRCQQH